MKIPYFNLKGARNVLITKPINTNKSSSRRQFVKTLGIGAVAINPAVELVKSISNEPFHIIKGEDFLKVVRNGVTVWDINTGLFGGDALLWSGQSGNDWTFSVKNAQLPGTLLSFSIEGCIRNKQSTWYLGMEIPELDIQGTVPFLDFLDKVTPLCSKAVIPHRIIELSPDSWLEALGSLEWSLTPDWKMSFAGKDRLKLSYCDIALVLSGINLYPGFKGKIPFLHPAVKTGTLTELQGLSHPEEFFSSLKYNQAALFYQVETPAAIHIFSGKTANGKKVGVIWADGTGKGLQKKDSIHEMFRFRDYFFSSVFSGVTSPQLYFSARLEEGGQWVNNPIGSFKLIRNAEIPDLEAFGYGTTVDIQYFEPRMRAFQPRIEGGYALPTVFGDAPLVRIEDQQPVRRVTNPNIRNVQAPVVTSPPATETRPAEETQPREEPQDPVRRTQVTAPTRVVQPQQPPTPTNEPQRQDPVRQVAQPAIQVEFNKIRFSPRKSMSLKVLRPEDLIWLEFEFNNFRFSNKGQSSFLELENPKNPGIVIIRFPSQHTLEEAWFEVTTMDSGSTQAVNLPARHIRAQRSRLVYELEAGHPGFEMTMEQLLDWSKFKLRVHPRAWIKLPQVIGQLPKGFASPVQRTAPATTRNLSVAGSSGDFRIRMAETSKIKNTRTEVYSETNLSQALAPDKSASLSATFDVSKLKIDMKTGPVPDLSTSIEAPSLLYISPNQVNDFFHIVIPKFRDTDEARETNQQITTQFRVLDPLNTSRGELTELWHTALGVKLGNQKVSVRSLAALKTIRALWAFDAKEDYKGCAEIDQPFQASLDASDRHKLVHTTSNYSIQGFNPIPVPVKKLMLTTLGAYLDWHAFFDVPSPTDTHLNVIEWQHLATLGRDHYVKIVREGYLFPLGHRAALVKVTERKFDKTTRAAVNRMRMYIVVLEKEVLYDRNDAAGKFIKFPFQAVRIENDSTPDIDKPVNIPLGSGIQPFRIALPQQGCKQKPGRSSTYNFYIHVAGNGFPFDITATDKEGAEHNFRMPLAFVENVVGRTKNMVDTMVADYNPKKQYTETSLGGRVISYAESLLEGDTAFETELLTFGAQYYPAPGEADLKFHPVMQSAKVFIKQVDELTGSRNPATIQMVDDNNDGYVFASVAGAVVDFTGGSDKAGGFMTPNMAITGLSKLQGPVGGKIEDMMNLDFVPEEFFKAMESLPVGKIFGVIDIFSLLLSKPNLKGTFTPMINQVKAARQEIDKLKNDILLLQNEAKETGNNLEAQINQKKNEIKAQTDKLLKALNDQVPKIPNLKTWLTTEAFYAEYKWIPEFESNNINLFGGILGVSIDKPKEALQITTTFKKPLDGSTQASLSGSARFSNFGIKLKDVLGVNFNYMEFISGTGKKTDVKVDLNKEKPIEFVGVLSFVNNLQSLIPNTGFSDDGPYVNLSPAGVKAGFNLSVPDVEVGVFMLSNISLGAYINLPFNGDELTLGFNFCRRENPFLLTVSCFGGGGYFMMVTTLKGLKSVEAAFEFGAAVSLNLGVASGGVSIVGGFFFKFEVVSAGVEELTLTGYIRINGNMSILGIINISLEFYLALTAVFVEKTIGTGEKVKKVEKMEGIASLKVKVEVLFFSKTVSVTVRRQFAGADADPGFADMILAEDWQEYCLAFEG